MNCLFITSDRFTASGYASSSLRYRCLNIAEIAQRFGHQVQLRSPRQIKRQALRRVDVVYWLNPKQGSHLTRILRDARQVGARCIAGTDTLDPASCTDNSDMCLCASDALRQFDAIIAPTAQIHQQLEHMLPKHPIATIQSGLSELWLEYVDQLSGQPNRNDGLFYIPMPHHPTHQLENIAAALEQWFTDSIDDKRLTILGDARIPDSALLRNRISIRAVPDPFTMPDQVRHADTIIAPLSPAEVDKLDSHITFIESAALGCPLIATATPALLQHKVPGLMLADSAAQWLECLFESGAAFKSANSASLRQYVRTHCTAMHYSEALIKAWDEGLLIPDIMAAGSQADAA